MIANLTAKYNASGMDGASIAIKKVAGMVQQQAHILSFMDVFLLLTTFFATLVFLTAFMSKPKGAMPADAGGH